MNNNIFDNNDQITPSQNEPKMVRVELNALGNIANDPRAIVLLLTPIKDRIDYEESLFPETTFETFQQFFPVPVPIDFSSIYFQRISNHKTADLTHDISNAFLKQFGIEICQVEIKGEQDGFVTAVTYKNGYNEIGTIYTKLHIAIIHALLHKVPIYVDEILLKKISQTVKLNFISAEERQDVDIVPDALTAHIKRGDKPNDLDIHILDHLLRNLKQEKLDDLTQIAIKYEVYEWAQLFSDLQQEHKEQQYTENEDNQ